MTEDGIFETHGGHIAYDVTGDGHPMVMAHAGVADRRMYDGQLDAFAQRYRVVRLDHRACGRSQGDPAIPVRYHEDIADLMAFLTLPNAYVVGTSMGGSGAIDLAISRPDLVDALVLAGAGLGGWEGEDDPETVALDEAAEAAIEAGDYDRAADLEIQIWAAGPGRTLDDVEPRVRDLMRQMLIPSYAVTLRGEKLDPPAVGRLDEITCPTLIIVGEHDQRVIHEIADDLERGIANSRRVLLPGVAHLPSLEDPATFNGIVLDFLAEVDASR